MKLGAIGSTNRPHETRESIVLLSRNDDGSFHVIYGNQSFIEGALALGLDPFEPSTLVGALNERDQANVLQVLDEVFGGLGSRSVLAEIDRPTGVLWLRISVHPIPAQDSLHAVVVFQDVTQYHLGTRTGDGLARHESRFAPLTSLLEEVSDFVVVTDAQAQPEECPRISFVNRAFAQCIGVEHRDLVGETLAILPSAKNPKEVLYRIAMCLREGTPIADDVLIARPHLPEVWIDVSGRPLRDENGAITAWMLLGRPID